MNQNPNACSEPIKDEIQRSTFEALFDSGYDSNAVSVLSSTSSTSFPSTLSLASDLGRKSDSSASVSKDILSDASSSFSRKSSQNLNVDSGLCLESEQSEQSCSENNQKSKFAVSIQNPNFYKYAFHQDEDGDTLLHLAIAAWKTDIASQLIDSAADSSKLELTNDLLQTPLHLAALTKQTQLVRKLILAGVDTSIRNSDGNTGLHIACQNGDFNSVKFFFRSPESRYDACYRNGEEILTIKNYQGETCLHIAAKQFNRKIIEFLVSVGADINEREDKSGNTLLHIAVELEKIEFIQFLLKQCSAFVNTVNYARYTPLHLAWYMLQRSPKNKRIRIMIHLLKECGGIPPDFPEYIESESDSDELDVSP